MMVCWLLHSHTDSTPNRIPELRVDVGDGDGDSLSGKQRGNLQMEKLLPQLL
jgi:hypothetical protein